MVGTDVIDHELDMLNVETPCTNTRRNQNILSFLLKVLDCELSVGLVHATMQHKTLIANVQQLLEKVICVKLLLNED